MFLSFKFQLRCLGLDLSKKPHVSGGLIMVCCFGDPYLHIPWIACWYGKSEHFPYKTV